MPIKKYILFVILIVTAGCKSTHNNYTTVDEKDNTLITNGKLYSSLFIQRVAEYKSLCFQDYNIATLRLQHIIDNHSFSKPLNAIRYIDETVLDNMPNSVHQAFAGKDLEPKAWKRWTANAEADMISEAKTFFDFAKSKGVEVFYIINRNESERDTTLKNLQKFNFPFADDVHLLSRITTSGKVARRNAISQTHEIVLLCGDNLSEIFDQNAEEKEPIV